MVDVNMKRACKKCGREMPWTERYFSQKNGQMKQICHLCAERAKERKRSLQRARNGEELEYMNRLMLMRLVAAVVSAMREEEQLEQARIRRELWERSKRKNIGK